MNILDRIFDFHQDIPAEAQAVMTSLRADVKALGARLLSELPDVDERKRALDTLDDTLKHAISALARPVEAVEKAVEGCCKGNPTTTTTDVPPPASTAPTTTTAAAGDGSQDATDGTDAPTTPTDTDPSVPATPTPPLASGGEVTTGSGTVPAAVPDDGQQ